MKRFLLAAAAGVAALALTAGPAAAQQVSTYPGYTCGPCFRLPPFPIRCPCVTPCGGFWPCGVNKLNGPLYNHTPDYLGYGGTQIGGYGTYPLGGYPGTTYPGQPAGLYGSFPGSQFGHSPADYYGQGQGGYSPAFLTSFK